MALHSGKQWLIKVVVVFLAMIGLGVGLFKALTSQQAILATQPFTAVDTFEANRKLKLFAFDLKTNRTGGGFISLSEAEINGLLDENFTRSKKAPAPVGLFLNRCAVSLTPTDLTLHCVVSRNVLGYSFRLLWQRTVAPKEEKGRWTFPVSKMKVGLFPIPVRFWPKIDSIFGTIDNAFTNKSSWVASLPAMELSTNTETNSPQFGAPEFKIYTFVPSRLKSQ